MKNQG